MKIRLHRGTFADSIETMEEIEPTFEAIRGYFTKRRLLGYQPNDTVQLALYSSEPVRGWKAEYAVLVNGSIVGFTDESVSEASRYFVDSLEIHMPRGQKDNQSNPVIPLRLEEQPVFRAIPNDTPGLLRAYLNAGVQKALHFLWGDLYRIHFYMTADLTLTQTAEGLKVSDHNPMFEISAIFKAYDELDLTYGEGLAIKHILEDLVMVTYNPQIAAPVSEDPKLDTYTHQET